MVVVGRTGVHWGEDHFMMSIGAFACSTGLSVKTLRFYDERGLLRPADVDPHTGYRSYLSSQLRQARTIRVLRATGMSLESVGRALAEPDRLPELLSAHRAQLAQERQRQDRALALADRPDHPVEIATRQVAAAHWVGIAYEFDVELDEAAVEAIFEAADAQLGLLFQSLTEVGSPPIGQFWTAMPLTGATGSVTVLLAWPVAEPAPVGFGVTGLDIRQGTLPERVEAYVVQSGAERSDQLDDLPGGPLPDPTWIALAEHGEAAGAEPAELRQTTSGQSAEDWTAEYAVTVAVL